MSKFAVTLNYHGNYGYVEYDSENKKAEIVLVVAEAISNFKICLTRLWFNTDVLVEWSMPPGMTENL